MANLQTRHSSTAILSQLLDHPQLPSLVNGVPAEVLYRTIAQVGLEDCGEIIALASVERLQELFDLDLWAAIAPGEAEELDSGRFFLWMELLREGGEAVAVEKLLGMERDLVVHSLCDQLLVLRTADMVAMAAERARGTQFEELLDNCSFEELADCHIISRNPATFDTILALLVALDRDHHHELESILDHCVRITLGRFDEEDGFSSALSDAASLYEDVKEERDIRRAKRGFVRPADGKAFLACARVMSTEEILAGGADPICGAFFRAFEGGPSTREALPRGRRARKPGLALKDEIARMARQHTTLLLPGGGRQRLLERLAGLEAEDGALFARRMAELAFCANALQAGESRDGRPYRSGEAVQEAVEACARGLDALCQDFRDRSDCLTRISMEKLFLLGRQ